MNKTLHFICDFEDFTALDSMAATFLSLSEPYKILTLQGELGSGKTTLVKFFCNRLNITSLVSSPTFGMINHYQTNEGDLVAYHMDMFRIEGIDDALQLGLYEYFRDNKWCFIEWPEKISAFLPEIFVSLKIDVDPVSLARKITLRVP